MAGVRAQLELRREPAAASQARRWTSQELRTAVPATVLSDVLLVVSELVSNASDHGGAPIVLRLATDGPSLTLEVRDSGDGWPQRGQPTAADQRGRGLLIVERVSSEWGVTFHRDGKTVWARMDTSHPD